MLQTKAADPTDAVFGKDTEGKTFKARLSGGPHWLVCGQSGSGKSVYLNALLVSMMSHAHPSELTIMAIDPKKVEFGIYTNLPFCPVAPVTDMHDAYGLLSYLCWEMDARFDLLEKTGTKQLSEFNEYIEQHPKEAEQNGYKRMKYIVCVIDEYNDLVMQEDTVEELIIRLAQKARAAGITLLIATQRPSADVISPIIKANIPARIGLKTTDSTNSMIVIDENGCENLAGYGDSYVLMDSSLTRVQGPYITNEELLAIFDHLKETFGESELFDYKQVCVDNGLCEWAEDYGDDVPYKDKHLKKVSASGGFW